MYMKAISFGNDYSYQPYQESYTVVEDDGAEIIFDPGPNLPQIAAYTSYLLRVE